MVPEEEPELLSRVVKIFKDIPENIEIDLFGEIYEFFLGEFARLYPGGASILEFFGAKDLLLKLIQNKNMELKNRALVCLQKIMMKSLKK